MISAQREANALPDGPRPRGLSLGSRRRKGSDEDMRARGKGGTARGGALSGRGDGHAPGPDPEPTGEPSSARSESGKVLLARRGSDADLLAEHRTSKKVLQWSLLVVAVLLTVHAVVVLRRAVRQPSFDLDTAAKWDRFMIVWSSGWITAASTGLGALPFLCFARPSLHAVASCNAVAAGMMLAAAAGLVVEGCFEETTPDTVLLPALRVLAGIYLGVGLVKGSSYFFGESEPTDLLDSSVLDTRRVFVIMAVMTLHSFSEGVGIGVSYHSQSLGGFVSATLAIHNVPEGLAISIVLIPRGYSLLSAALWCIFSSLPQPLMAVPAYFFTQQFRFVLPIGLGLAAGAMAFVAFTELLPEALESLSPARTYTIAFLSMLFMGIAQVVTQHAMIVP